MTSLSCSKCNTELQLDFSDSGLDRHSGDSVVMVGGDLVNMMRTTLNHPRACTRCQANWCTTCAMKAGKERGTTYYACPRCGAGLGEYGDTPTIISNLVARAHLPASKPRRKSIQRVVITLGLVAVVFAAYWFLFRSKPQSESQIVWARIVLDNNLFPDVRVWRVLESAYDPETSDEYPNEPITLIGIDKVNIDRDHKLPFPAPEALFAKFGEGKIEATSQGPTAGKVVLLYLPVPTEKPSASSGGQVIYHVYGPIAFGIKPGETHFSRFRAPTRFFHDGFIHSASSAIRDR